MRFIKLTALLSIPMFVLLACNGTSDLDEDFIYVGATTMNGTQEVPAVTTSATGTINANYNKQTKILSYTLTFSGLTKPDSVAQLHGTGEAGIAAPALQNFIGFPAATAGSYTGTLLIDGVKILENELLGGRYYINLHNSAYKYGEIRGQLILAKK